MEENKLKDILKNNMQRPDSEWQEKTLQSLQKLSKISTTTESKNSGLNNLIFNWLLMDRKKMILASVVAVSVIAILAFGGIYLYKNKSNDGVFSTAEEQRILSQIAEKNSTKLNITKNNSARNTTEADSMALAPNASDQKLAAGYSSIFAGPYAGYENNQLIYTKTRFYYGAQTCGGGVTDQINSVNETYNFYDETGSSIYKSIDTDDNGSLYGYYVTTSTSGTSESYEYKGGSYAIKQVSTYSIDPVATDAGLVREGDAVALPAPVESEKTTTDIQDYFGPDAKITKKETLNGKTYLIVESSYKTDCSTQVYETTIPDFWNGEDWSKYTFAANANDVVTTVYWVEEGSLDLYKTETHMGINSPNNLMYGNEILESSKTAMDFAQAKQQARFDVQTEIKEIVNVEPTVVDTEANNAKQVADFDTYMRTNSIKPLTVTASSGLYFSGLYTTSVNPASSSISSISMRRWNPNSDYEKFRSAREFYPVGNLGDKLYATEIEFYNNVVDVQNNDYPQSLVNTSFSDVPLGNTEVTKGSLRNMNVDIYDKSIEDLKIINTKLYLATTARTIKDVNVIVSGINISAKVYEYSYKNITEYDLNGNPVDCPDNSCVVSNYFLIFNHGSHKYVVSESLMNDLYQPQSLSFSSEIGNRIMLIEIGSADYQNFLNDYKKSLENVYTILPATEPALF